MLLRSAAQFKHEVETSKRKEVEIRKAEIERDHGDASSSSQSQRRKLSLETAAVERMAKLWNSFDQRLVLAGVRTDANVTCAASVTGSPEAIPNTLASGWFLTLCRIFCRAPGALVFAARCSNAFDFSRCQPTGSAAFGRFFWKVKHSPPGPDGLPYEAWQRSGDLGLQILLLLSIFISSALKPPINFNQISTCSYPKVQAMPTTLRLSRSHRTRALLV